MIKSYILGNIGRDVEIRSSQTGTPVANFSLATSSGYGANEKTEWINCAIFGNRADKLAPYLTKGTKVMVDGELSTRTFTRQDGTHGFSLELRVTDLQFAASRTDTNQPATQTYQAPPQQPTYQAPPPQPAYQAPPPQQPRQPAPQQPHYQQPQPAFPHSNDDIPF